MFVVNQKYNFIFMIVVKWQLILTLFLFDANIDCLLAAVAVLFAFQLPLVVSQI
jgi:hypothetical protein